jgi:hypothetical protein
MSSGAVPVFSTTSWNACGLNFDPSVSRALADVVARSISRDPSVRYASAHAMRDALLEASAPEVRDTIAIAQSDIPVMPSVQPSAARASTDTTLPVPPPRLSPASAGGDREREATMSTFGVRETRTSGVIWGVMTIAALLIAVIVFVLTR